MSQTNDPNSPAPAPAKTIVLSLPPEEKPGDRIGQYKLLQTIGEGGCGIVYMAEQEEPVRRRVALKVIKLGMDTKQVIARFEAERQALAMMDHPNIAKVLDAGATDKGRSFFVMELVRGIKITDYCDQNKLSARERLELFIQVCNAIQHAHQKGIIHRDIKPSNILVTLHDGVPVPKVIDFGIAKATQGRLTDQTLFTAFEQFIGTPAYMSPEQAEMSGLDIDTRSDIYSLGVLLYELLTGTTPFDPKELLNSGLDGLRRTIREKEPDRPSTRLTTMVNVDLVAVAHRRKMEAPGLIHLLCGDVDWIVMKALEKDRTRRYETANGFAMDVQRYLVDEPILARPPGAFYRFQKLVRRNKLAFVAGAAVMLALALGFGVSTALFLQERKARKRADEAERVQASLAREAEAGRRLEAEKREHAQLGEKLGMGGLYLSQGKFDEAEKEVADVPIAVLTNYVPTAAIFGVVAERHARHGEWAAAEANFEKVAAIVPNNFGAYHSMALLLLETGNAETRSRHGEWMIRQFSGAADPATSQRLVKDCLLLLPPSANPKTMLETTDRLLAAASKDQSWVDLQFTKGLAEYRARHFQSAIDWLDKSAEAPDGDRYSYAQSELTKALAQYQLGQTNAARATLGEVIRYVGERLPKFGRDTFSEKWSDWIVVNALMREATTLIPGAETNQVKDPPWLTTLTEGGFKVISHRLEDETWQVGIDDQPLADLSPLRGARISRLSVMHTKISDLSPLQGMPLKMLRLAGTAVTDLSPLAGMKLESLQVSETGVADLTPIRGMPLQDLRMTDCTNIIDLKPLAGMTSLQNIILPRNATGFEFLRGVSSLAYIGFKYDPVTKGPDRTAAAFWAEFDRTESAKKTVSSGP